MKDIHHTCRCTEQQFTFKEWCAWIESHEKAGQNSSEFVALSHNGFDFNIHDVCLTPNRPVRLFNAHCIVEVKTAQSPNGRWDYGLDVNLHNSGHYVGSGSSTMQKKATQRKPPRFLPPCSMPANQPNANWRTVPVAPGRIPITRTMKTDSSKTVHWPDTFGISSSKSTISAGQRRSNN